LSCRGQVYCTAFGKNRAIPAAGGQYLAREALPKSIETSNIHQETLRAQADQRRLHDGGRPDPDRDRRSSVKPHLEPRLSAIVSPHPLA